jgi:hypothetical protein
MNPCVTCNGRTERLAICWTCAERAESMLHAPVRWTRFERATMHPDIAAEGFEECWMNSRYTVLIRRPKSDMGDLVHLSIKRNDKSPLHDWRDLQRIKNEILGNEEEAMELYPAESRLVDGANHHLWCFRMRAPFGYDAQRCVMLPVGMDGAKQRPFEEPPKDAMNEEEFQEKLKEYHARRAARAGLTGQVKSVLETAHVRPCQRPEWNVDAKKCEDVWPADPGYWCGPCMAKILQKLTTELEQM